jgi:peroxiredoxin
MMIEEGQPVPAVAFNIREDGEWKTLTSYELFANKKVILFALPGAFTPTCSTYQLPGFEENFEKFQELGIDDIYCLSVNDTFVMNAWAESQGIKKVKMIPDGSLEFTEGMGMAVCKDNLGFGVRSWRYAAIIENGVLVKMFEEDDMQDDAKNDPYEESSPENLLEYLS